MRTKQIAKSLGKFMPIEELLPYCRKSRSPERMAESAIWPEAPKQPFPRTESYYFELTCMNHKAIVYVDCAN